MQVLRRMACGYARTPLPTGRQTASAKQFSGPWGTVMWAGSGGCTMQQLREGSKTKKEPYEATHTFEQLAGSEFEDRCPTMREQLT